MRAERGIQTGAKESSRLLGWAPADALAVTVAERSPSGGAGLGGGGSGGTGGEDDGELLSDRDLRQIEREFPDGLTSVQIVDIFTQRGIRFSEATFRKYVQQGLLPRSRRVGRKGKHQGSMGLYPPTTVRRINSIKRLMAQNHTIEEIQTRFLRYRDEIEALERGITTILGWFDEDLNAPHLDASKRKELRADIAVIRRNADDMFQQLERLERALVRPKGPTPTGAPEGFEDLL